MSIKWFKRSVYALSKINIFSNIERKIITLNMANFLQIPILFLVRP